MIEADPCWRARSSPRWSCTCGSAASSIPDTDAVPAGRLVAARARDRAGVPPGQAAAAAVPVYFSEIGAEGELRERLDPARRDRAAPRPALPLPAQAEPRRVQPAPGRLRRRRSAASGRPATPRRSARYVPRRCSWSSTWRAARARGIRTPWSVASCLAGAERGVIASSRSSPADVDATPRRRSPTRDPSTARRRRCSSACGGRSGASTRSTTPTSSTGCVSSGGSTPRPGRARWRTPSPAGRPRDGAGAAARDPRASCRRSSCSPGEVRGRRGHLPQAPHRGRHPEHVRLLPRGALRGGGADLPPGVARRRALRAGHRRRGRCGALDRDATGGRSHGGCTCCIAPSASTASARRAWPTAWRCSTRRSQDPTT